ncbi:MAG: hypothetical protein GY937_07780 [bacterium]|nr:hypothetical protein [bacterium]
MFRQLHVDGGDPAVGGSVGGGIGTPMYVQMWYRDLGLPDGVGWSDALVFAVLPPES